MGSRELKEIRTIVFHLPEVNDGLVMAQSATLRMNAQKRLSLANNSDLA
jgi:hypothetical protein